jgi:hypothetical protein
MAYSAQEGRLRLTGDLASAIQSLAVALACLGEAYELLDEGAAAVLEEQLFHPVQSAYGRARRMYAEFAARHGLPESQAPPPSSGTHSSHPRVYLQRELRDGISSVRELIAPVPGRIQSLIGVVGR